MQDSMRARECHTMYHSWVGIVEVSVQILCMYQSRLEYVDDCGCL